MDITPATHRTLAVAAFNSTWDLLDVTDDERSEDQNEEMLRRAYAAAYHWQRAEGYATVNEARSLWMLSRVWRAIGNGPQALYYANRCLAVTEEANLVDFDLAYAFDGMARALALTGKVDEARTWWERAMEVEVQNDGDRQQLLSDIGTAP
jgi:tetratricopeptide (TPR) repeat protein